MGQLAARVSRPSRRRWPKGGSLDLRVILRLLRYVCCISSPTRITVTLPSDQVAELRKLTDNVSGYVAEAVARQIRHQLLGDDLRRHEAEHGTFSDEELAEARAKIFGSTGTSTGADAA